MKRRIHMCQSVRGPLKNWSSKQWDDACDWISKGDGTKFRCGEELEFWFQKLLDEGNEVLPYGECDNFDPKTGCRGHDIEEVRDVINTIQGL